MTTLIAIVIQTFSFAVLQEPGRLTEDQLLFILKVKGDWRIEQVFAGEEIFKGQVSTTVRFTKQGMVFLNKHDPQERVWQYTQIETTKDRIDLRLDKDGKIHTYSLCKKDEKIWLVTRVNGNSEIPDVLEPKDGQMCLVLSRLPKE